MLNATDDSTAAISGSCACGDDNLADDDEAQAILGSSNSRPSRFPSSRRSDAPGSAPRAVQEGNLLATLCYCTFSLVMACVEHYQHGQHNNHRQGRGGMEMTSRMPQGRWPAKQQRLLDNLHKNDPQYKKVWVPGQASEDFCCELLKALRHNDHVTYLQFDSNRHLTNHFCQRLAAALANDRLTSVVILKVRNCPSIDDDGMQTICKAMAKNTHVLELNISGNGATSECTDAVASMLESNTTLVECYCDRYAWDNAAFQILANGIVANYHNGGSLLWAGLGYFHVWDADKADIMEHVYELNPQIVLSLPHLDGRPRIEASKAVQATYRAKLKELQDKYGKDHW